MMKYNKYKVLIITCWSLLGLCCLIKLFGFNLFIASTDNQSFIRLCDTINNSFWYYIVGFIFHMITCSIYYMAVLKESKPTISSLKWFIPLIIYIICKTIFYYLKVVFFVLDIVMMIGLPILINRKIWYIAIVSFLLTLFFQLISAFLKLNHYTMFDDNTLVAVLLSIDYVIMLVLFWLYRVRKEVS